MSKIEFEQIDDNEVEVILPPETPMEMVEQIKKSFISRGLVEDLSKSTVNVRYFFRPQDDINKIADELIKSLKSLTKEDDFIQSPKNIKQWKRTMAARDAMTALTSKRPSSTSVPNKMSNTPTPPAPPTPATSFHPKISGKVNYKKSESDKEDEDESDVEKSGYGPKKAGLYNPADNARRKANNLTDQIPSATNTNVKAYSSKPGQLSAKQQAADLAAKQRALSRKQPVKTMKDMTPEELADITARTLKKSWTNHGSIPTAAEAIQQTNRNNPVEKAENLMANQLANLMNNKAMLGQSHRQPSSEDFIMAGEQMGMGTSEEVVKSQDKQWNNTINNWLVEATKPISQKFASEEEELAYWNSIKVGDKDDGKSGY